MRVLIATTCLLLIASSAAAAPLSELNRDTPITGLQEPAKAHGTGLRDDPVNHTLHYASVAGVRETRDTGMYYACWTAYWATLETTNGVDPTQTKCAEHFQPSEKQSGRGFSAARMFSDVQAWGEQLRAWGWDLIFG